MARQNWDGKWALFSIGPIESSKEKWHYSTIRIRLALQLHSGRCIFGRARAFLHDESDRLLLNERRRRRSEEIGQLTLKNSRRLCQTFPYFTASLSESEWRGGREWNRGGPKPNEMKGGVVGMPFTQSSTTLTHSHTLLRPTKKSFKGSKDST